MSRLGRYLETWQTPYWRRVVTTVLGAGAFVGWGLATDLARDRVAAGEGWSAAATAALPGVALCAVLAATALGLAIRNARREGRSRHEVLRLTALLIPAAVAFTVSRIGAVREPRLSAWLFAGALALVGAAAPASRPRRWSSWLWAAGWIAGAVWFAARS